MRVSRFASDEVLVARVRAGSDRAFEVLYDRHQRQLLAFCRSMLGSVADAEDAVQQTFTAAYADLRRSGKPIALRPWLYTIARNCCLSMLRARRERPVAELPEPEVHLTAAVDAREELRATLADIAGLPGDQRAALILAEMGDVSHAEIAEILGCRNEKVKALVYQARSWLASGRTARETPCAEIRQHLAVGGVALRRTWLRHHVRHCVGCREFGEQVGLQRRRFRVLLPVAPGLGLKRLLLGAMWGSGGGAVSATTGLGGLAAAVVVSATIAGGGPGADASQATREPVRPSGTASHARHERPASARRPAAVRKRSPRATAPGVARPGTPTPAKASPVRAPEGREVRSADGAMTPKASAPEPPAETAAGSTSAPPPESPATAPAEQPGGGKPPEKPGGGKPPEPPGGGKPPETPGGGKPPEPPGGGKPPEPPGSPPAATDPAPGPPAR